MNHTKGNAEILSALKAAQEKDGYLSEEAIREIAARYGRFASEIYETATFYSMLSVEKQAEHMIEICGSTCCDAGRAKQLMDAVAGELHIAPGEITEDGKWMFRRCECLGRCDTAPNVMIDQTLIPNADAEAVIAMIRKVGE